MNTEQPQVHQAAPRTKAMQAPKKPGHPLDRSIVAALVRKKRAHPGASFSYSDWRVQMHILIRNKLAHLTKARKAAERVPSFAKIDAIATDEAREAFREHSALLRQVDANRRDPALGGLY